ncbi:MAG: sigma-70 family RNA polymerase sigma factor [Muribaculaceae bacterium]|nr:sigma-70 family RNA polymerase sigma factor [Muribaculaceae bacterium]
MSALEERCRYLYMKFAVSLMNYAKQYVGTFIAEDIVHDAFIRIYGKRMLQWADDEIKRILFTSVRNLCIDMLRHQDCVNDFNENHKMDIPESCDESNTTEDTSELYNRIVEVVKLLPAKRKQIFSMYYFNGLDSKEIASMLNLSQRTVENNIYRSLLFIRNILNGNPIDEE